MKAKRKNYRIYQCAAFCLITILASSTVSFSQNGSFRSDLQNSGFCNSVNRNFTFTKWKFKTQGMIFSTPLVAGENMYVGSDDSCLYAINKQTGTLSWKFKTAGPIPSSPAFHDSTVYFLSMDGNMYAINASTGAKQWEFATKGEHKRQVMGIMGRLPNDTNSPEYWDFYLSSPLVVDSLIFFGSSDSSVYALNRHSGKLAWRTMTGNGNHSTPAYYNNIVYCGSWDSKIYAFDALSGSIIWTYQTGLDAQQHLMTGIQASPSVSDGIVYITSRDAHCYALNAETGELIWKTKHGSSWLPSSPSFDDSLIYFGSSDAMKLFAIDKKTGKSIYERNTNFYCFSSPAITNEFIYEGLLNGRLQTFEKRSGKLRTEFQNATSIQNFLGLQNGDGSFNITPMYNGIDYKYVIADSLYLDRIFKLGALISSPVTADGLVYITSTDSCIYALQSTALQYTDSTHLGTLPKNEIIPFNIQFSINENAYDSVTMAVKSKYEKHIKSVSDISILSQLQTDTELELSANLHTEAFSPGSKHLPLYLDFWQDGDRHRAIIELHFEIENQVGLDINSERNTSLACYPSPTNKELYIEFEWTESAAVDISLLNTAGVLMFQDEINPSYPGIQKYTLNEKFPQGIYTLILKGNQRQLTQSVLIAE